MEKNTIVGDIFFYYWTELIQILVSLRYEYIFFFLLTMNMHC